MWICEQRESFKEHKSKKVSYNEELRIAVEISGTHSEVKTDWGIWHSQFILKPSRTEKKTNNLPKEMSQ